MTDHLKKTIAVYDLIAQDYAKKIDAYTPRPEQEKFISLLPKYAKILDAGCGPGRDCDYFVKHGFNVIGVDLSENLLTIARQRVPEANFLKQDLRKLNFPLNSFDGIWACASLHHMYRRDVPKALINFYRILKPEGILFVMVKEGTGGKEIRESLSSDLPRHYEFYKSEELTKLLKEAGFIEVENYMWREEDRHPTRGNSELVLISSFSKKS